MAVAKDGFSARYNMTHKEVSDSKYNLILCFVSWVCKHCDAKHCLFEHPHQPNLVALDLWCEFGGGTICLDDQWQMGECSTCLK